MTDDDLYGIEISRDDRPAAHTTVSIGPAVDWTNPAVMARHRFVERVAAAHHMAGVLGRLAAELAGELLDAAQRHGCARKHDRCRVYADGLADPLTMAVDEHDEPVPGRYELAPFEPALEIVIPVELADQWLRRIGDRLEFIAEADARELTGDMELISETFQRRGES